jgi:hypothetical protein
LIFLVEAKPMYVHILSVIPAGGGALNIDSTLSRELSPDSALKHFLPSLSQTNSISTQNQQFFWKKLISLKKTFQRFLEPTASDRIPQFQSYKNL